jgi:hypothetical protein
MGVKVTQFYVEVLRAVDTPKLKTYALHGLALITGPPLAKFSAHAEQVFATLLVTSGGSAGVSTVSLTAQLVAILSGTSGVANVLLAPGTLLSAEWVVSGGIEPHTYDWSFSGHATEAGFVSTAATSAVARTYAVGTGTRGVSATVSDATPASVTSAFLVYVGAVVWPNVYDSNVTRETQPYRRVWPR